MKVDKNVTVRDGSLASNGSVSIAKDSQVEDLSGEGKLTVAKSTVVHGDIIFNDDVSLEKDVVVNGDVDGHTITLSKDALIDGNATAIRFTVARFRSPGLFSLAQRWRQLSKAT